MTSPDGSRAAASTTRDDPVVMLLFATVPTDRALAGWQPLTVDLLAEWPQPGPRLTGKTQPRTAGPASTATTPAAVTDRMPRHE